MAPHRRVLVVDDDRAIRDVVSETLGLEGYEVDTASNGLEALAKMREQVPDAVVLDLMMPGLDGWGFVERCRTEPSLDEVPIVVMSAGHRAATVANQIGAAGYISKPFDLDELLEAVEQTL